MTEPDVVVVGAGHNGLAAAAYLAREGLDVLVLERRAFPGGAVATEELVPGFRFSSCSYITHMLHERVVEELGIDAFLPRIHPHGASVTLLPDGGVFRRAGADTDPDRAATARAVTAAFSAADGEGYARWDREWEQMAHVVDRFVLGPAPTLEGLREEARRQGVEATFERFAGQSYVQLLEETFPSPAARGAFAPNLDGDVHAPGAPLSQAYYETQRLRALRYQGIPEGGMGAVSRAFAHAAEAAGARLRLGAEVALILVEDGVARGVELAGGERIRARLVVSNADPKRTFLRLCERRALPPGVAELVEGLDSSPGGIKIHCALREVPDVARLTDGGDARGLGLIDVLPGEDWWLRVPAERAAGAFPDAAFLQLQIPTLTDPTLAPRGHVVSGFMPHVAPRLAQGSWSGRRAELAELLLTRIEAAVPNLRDALVDYVLFTPEDLESRVGLTDGNIRHLAHLPGQAFDSRPLRGWSDGSTPVQGLFLCGAGIHPGGEVSGANGRNAARTVLASASRPGTEG